MSAHNSHKASASELSPLDVSDPTNYILESKLPATSSDKVKCYFFIGRLNPPHSGHIAALSQMVEIANAEGYMPVILLGDGPAKEQMENPISFELKRDILLSKLRGEYVVLQRTNQLHQVMSFVKTSIARHSGGALHSVNIMQVAGNKEEDTKKLDYMKPILADATKELVGPDIEITTGTMAIDAVEVGGMKMSATIVRLDACEEFVAGGDGSHFLAKYSEFYGAFTPHVYAAISAKAAELSPAKLARYIEKEHNKLSGHVSGHKRKRIASKTSKSKGGNRNKTRKYRRYLS